MKAFQLLKRVGGFYNLRSLYTSSFAAGPSRRVPFPQVLTTTMPITSQISLQNTNTVLSPTTTTTTFFLHQMAAESHFQEEFQKRSFSSDITKNAAFPMDNPDVWEAYEKSMKKVIAPFPEKPNKKVSVEQFKQVQQYLLSKETIHNSPLVVSDDNEDEDGNKQQNFSNRLNERKESFIQATNFTLHQYDLAMRCIATLGSMCAKEQVVLPLLVAWDKIKDGGMALRPNFISAFTYVFSLEEEYLSLSSEVATFQTLLFGVTENSLFLRIKALATVGEVDRAETLLDKLKDEDDGQKTKRLRTFMPILQHYCDQGNIYSILRLWKRIREAPGAHLDSETYATIVGSIARFGHFHRNAKPIEGLSDLGLKPCGPALLDEIFNVMMEDLVDLSEEAAIQLYNDFVKGFTAIKASDSEDASDSATTDDALKCIRIGAEGNLDNTPDLIAGKVIIDHSTAVCPETGTKLKLFTLDSDQRNHFRDTLFEMAATPYEDSISKSKKKKAKTDGQYADEELRKFSEWLETRDGEPFTAFVDGANVAYFGQGCVRYSQVLRVVEELEKMGERPLVIMPRKYVNSQFRLGPRSHFQIQTLELKELDVIKRLINAGKFYIVPAQCLDDYYWMLASVSTQNGKDTIHVPSSETDRLLAGIRPILISNDRMRDHKLELLEPKLFRRWYSSHMVTYSISPFDEDEWEPRTVNFAPADNFSREIQGNPADGLEMTGTAWHFPVSTWEESVRFCIAIHS